LGVPRIRVDPSRHPPRTKDRSMTLRSIHVPALTLLIAACGPNEESEMPTDLARQARRIAETAIIMDTHVDVPYRLSDVWEDVSEATA